VGVKVSGHAPAASSAVAAAIAGPRKTGVPSGSLAAYSFTELIEEVSFLSAHTESIFLHGKPALVAVFTASRTETDEDVQQGHDES